MNKFDDYNASQIVPQKTLLEKFNKVIKFLVDNPTYNLFLSSENYIDTGTVYNISLIQDKKHELEVGDLVLFNNVYVGVVSMVGETTYSISKAIYFKGAQGEKGDSGNNFKIIGTVNSTDELPSSAPYGTAYFVGTIPPRNVYVFDSLTNSWINEGHLQAAISIEETAQHLVGDNDISISYLQDTKEIKFTFNSGNYYTRQQITELLAGKCKSYVINSKSDITGTDSGDEITNVSAITGVDLEDLNIGDMVLLKNTEQPDYWVSQVSPTVSLNKLEISKVDLLNGIYPVGSIYMNIANVNPASLFGGTWVALNGGNPCKILTSDGIKHLMFSSSQLHTPGDMSLNDWTDAHSYDLIFRGNAMYRLGNEVAPSLSGAVKLSVNNGYVDIGSGISIYLWQRTA